CSPRRCARSTTNASWCAWWNRSAPPCTAATSRPCGRRPPAPTTAPRGEARVRHAAEGQEQGERTLWLGAAVTLLAVAGICALLGGHLLLGVLRLAAGLLAGAGLGAALLAVLGPRLPRRARGAAAGLLALVLAAALTTPAVVATRLDPLEQSATASIAALGEGDVVHSLPLPDAPVLVRRTDGSSQLLDAHGVRPVDASAHDVLALSHDGTHLVRATGASTAVLSLDRSLSTPDGGLPTTTF